MAAQRPYNTTAYRYPGEQLILALTLLLVSLVIALTATATVCLSFVFAVAMVALSYAITRSHHKALLEQARQVTPQDTHALATLVTESIARLQPGPVQIFVALSNALNAYVLATSN